MWTAFLAPSLAWEIRAGSWFTPSMWGICRALELFVVWWVIHSFLNIESDFMKWSIILKLHVRVRSLLQVTCLTRAEKVGKKSATWKRGLKSWLEDEIMVILLLLVNVCDRHRKEKLNWLGQSEGKLWQVWSILWFFPLYTWQCLTLEGYWERGWNLAT